jgi:type II secretory pathway pseudopilin PulG
MRSRSAFTLIEIVLALGVAALAVVGIMALLPAGLDSGRSAQVETVASNLAQWMFEDRFLGRGFSAVESEYGGATLPVRLLPDSSRYADYEQNYEVVLVGYRTPVPGLDLREVTISVGYPLYQGRTDLWDLSDSEREQIEIAPERRTWVKYTTYLSKRSN